ncbi:MAG: hypothetical protein KA974_07665, partial [Saprospiraceae bacterium]|nr:hypothetical protein [Saprospiraceae bacterium]
YNVVVEHLSHELNISQTSALTTVNQMIEKYNQTNKTWVQKRNDAEKLLKESLNKLATIQSQENQLLIELEQQKILQQRHTEVTSRIAALRVENFDLDAFQMLKSEVENYQPQYLDYIKKEGQVETLPELLKTREEANLRLVNGQKCVEQEIATLSDLQFDIEKFNRLKTEKELLHQQVLEQTTILNTTFIALKDVENQQLNIKNEIEQHNKHLKVIQEKKSEIGLLGQLLQVFDGFKIEILERVSPSISTYAGQLFNRITNGKYENILVDEDFRFHITDNGIEYPIARYSGGEQDLANLCLRIAVTQTIGEMNGNQSAINFLAFDEILGSQDEERRNEILTAFNTLRHDFKQIYIISHIETIREYFEHILEVSESPKGSVVRWI